MCRGLRRICARSLEGRSTPYSLSKTEILGAAGPTLIGAISAATGSYPLMISLLLLIYVIGLPFIAMAPKRRGRGCRNKGE